MLAQLTINQDLQADMIYSKEATNYLSKAIIKDAQGKNIMIEWGPIENQVKAATTNQALSNMVSKPLSERTTYIEQQINGELEFISDESLMDEGNKDLEEANNTEEKQVIKIELSKKKNDLDNNMEVKQSSNVMSENSSNNSPTSGNTASSQKTDDTTYIASTNNNEETNNQTVSQNTNKNDNLEQSETLSNGNQISSNTISSDIDNKENSSVTNNIDTELEKNIKTYYGISTTEAYKLQLNIGGKIQKNGKWITASSSEIQQYFVPSEENIQKYKFQFLNLASLAGISEEEAKDYLSDKGILKGKEATFLVAAKTYNVNEIYLMAHACLETGNGTSKLAQGVNYNGTIVYNMFGINAVDSDPIGQGAAYAYKMGWTTPEKAILGGAQFISTQYINNYPYNQDTLYEMRWNPASPGNHQYATDIAWATKQAEKMENIYSTFKSATLTFDIPVYRK